MTSGEDRELVGEVTRVKAVTYLQGPTAHAIGSLGFLTGGALVVWTTGRTDVAFGAVVVAWMVSVNGLSLYAWDRLRESVESTDEAGDDEDVDDGPERTLTGPSLSTEHRAELVAGFVQAAALILIIALSIEVVMQFGVETGGYLLAGVIAVGNVVALLWVVQSPVEGAEDTPG